MAKRGRKSKTAPAKRATAGKRGPPKKPSALLKQRGTFRSDRHSDDLEPVTPPNLPAAPAHLTDSEKRTWNEVGGKLAAIGLCSDLDAIALEVLVSSYCGMTDAAAELASGDLVVTVGQNETPMANPLVGVVAKQLATLKWCLTQFGMTPSARTSISLPEKPKEDPMAKLLGK